MFNPYLYSFIIVFWSFLVLSILLLFDHFWSCLVLFGLVWSCLVFLEIFFGLVWSDLFWFTMQKTNLYEGWTLPDRNFFNLLGIIRQKTVYPVWGIERNQNPKLLQILYNNTCLFCTSLQCHQYKHPFCNLRTDFNVIFSFFSFGI